MDLKVKFLNEGREVPKYLGKGRNRRNVILINVRMYFKGAMY